jgi:hypothetical protein
MYVWLMLLDWLVALVREAFIELDQFHELLAITTVIGMIAFCQGTKALLNLHFTDDMSPASGWRVSSQAAFQGW